MDWKKFTVGGNWDGTYGIMETMDAVYLPAQDGISPY
jgi:hypothetical protein